MWFFLKLIIYVVMVVIGNKVYDGFVLRVIVCRFLVRGSY